MHEVPAAASEEPGFAVSSKNGPEKLAGSKNFIWIESEKLSVGPAVRIVSVRRFATFLLPPGPPRSCQVFKKWRSSALALSNWFWLILDKASIESRRGRSDRWTLMVRNYQPTTRYEQGFQSQGQTLPRLLWWLWLRRLGVRSRGGLSNALYFPRSDHLRMSRFIHISVSAR